MPLNEPPDSRHFMFLFKATGVLAVVLGLAAAFGWFLHSETFGIIHRNIAFGILLTALIFIAISYLIVWTVLKTMSRVDEKGTEAELETQRINFDLEKLVAQQHTHDLELGNYKFFKIFDANPIGITIANLATGKYVDVNPAILELLQYGHDEFIGHTAAELSVVSAEFRQKIVENISTKGYIKNEDVILKDKYKNDKHCIMSAELLEINKELYMMSFVYDITNLKQTENNLQEAKNNLQVLTDQLTNQNKQLISFAHIISHNLRSPVGNLNLLMQFYKESTTQENKDDLWKNFETVIGHLNITLDDLLETLCIQEDTSKERELLSFEKVFEASKEILIGNIIQSGAIINTNFTAVPKVSYPKIYLESIMLNLVSNAIKYRSPLRVPVINISTQNINGQIVLTVQDNGMGINLQRHGKSLFGLRKTFHRHAEAKGLGLFITKTQVDAMGGEIQVDSIVDGGTTFKIIFNKIIVV